MRPEETAILPNLCLDIAAFIRLDFYFENLPHAFYRVEIENDVSLAPELPALADYRTHP